MSAALCKAYLWKSIRATEKKTTMKNNDFNSIRAPNTLPYIYVKCLTSKSSVLVQSGWALVLQEKIKG